MRTLRLMVVIAAALWLPLQAVAAVFLPLCQHQLSGEATMVQGEHHCNMGGHDVAEVPPEDGCDQCGFCHLAGVSALPATPVLRLALPTAADRAVPPAPTFRSHIPEPPRHPPKA